MIKLIQFFLYTLLCLSLSLNTQAQNVLDADWDDVVDGDCDDQNAAWWSSDEAIRIAENVMLYQRDIGGWPKNTDMQLVLSQAEKNELIADKSDTSGGYCTIDNNAVRYELKYLSKVYNAIADEGFKTTIKAAFLNGIQYLLDAQFDNGGWPQFYPFRSETSYSNHITYNDDAMTNVMEILRHIYQKDSEYAIVAGETMIAEARTAFDKGLECILKTQYIQNGTLTVWCAQHHYETLEPVMARSYELASLSGGESAGVIRLLMSIDDPSCEIINAIKHAVTWYDETRIIGYKLEDFVNDDGLDDRRLVADASAPDMWARFYTLDTNTPFFCSRDGIMRYSIAEISYERRNNYSWYVNSGHKVFAGYDTWYPIWGSEVDQETSIISPESGFSSNTGSVHIEALAGTCGQNTVEKFELFIDDEFIADFCCSEIDTVLTDLEDGTHLIKVVSTDNSGYSSMDQCLIIVKKPVSLWNTYADSNELNIYPNPSSNSFFIDLSNLEEASVEIYNLSGKMVYQTKLNKGIHKIHDHGLRPGIYILKAYPKTLNPCTQKIIIQ